MHYFLDFFWIFLKNIWIYLLSSVWQSWFLYLIFDVAVQPEIKICRLSLTYLSNSLNPPLSKKLFNQTSLHKSRFCPKTKEHVILFQAFVRKIYVEFFPFRFAEVSSWHGLAGVLPQLFNFTLLVFQRCFVMRGV